MLRVFIILAGWLFATSAMAACEKERAAYLADKGKAVELIYCLEVALAAASASPAAAAPPIAITGAVATDGIRLVGEFCPQPIVPNPVTGTPKGGNPNAIDVIRQSLLTYKLQSGLSDAAWWAALSTTTEPDTVRIIANRDKITGFLPAGTLDGYDMSEATTGLGVLDDTNFGLLKQVVPGKTVCLQ